MDQALCRKQYWSLEMFGGTKGEKKYGSQEWTTPCSAKTYSFSCKGHSLRKQKKIMINWKEYINKSKQKTSDNLWFKCTLVQKNPRVFVLIHCCSDAWADDLLIRLYFTVVGEVATCFCYEACIKTDCHFVCPIAFFWGVGDGTFYISFNLFFLLIALCKWGAAD